MPSIAYRYKQQERIVIRNDGSADKHTQNGHAIPVIQKDGGLTLIPCGGFIRRQDAMFTGSKVEVDGVEAFYANNYGLGKHKKIKENSYVLGCLKEGKVYLVIHGNELCISNKNTP